MTIGFLTLTLFWGFAASRSMEYLFAARRGHARVGCNHGL
jgi:hypothetical protein